MAEKFIVDKVIEELRERDKQQLNPEVKNRYSEMVAELNKKKAEEKPEKEKKEPKPLIKTFWGGQINSNFYELGYLEDELTHEKKTVFIEIPKKYDPAIHKPEDELKILRSIDINENTILIPPKVIPFKLPPAKITWQQILNTTFEACYKFIRRHIELFWTDEEEDYDILAMWVLLSYLQENLTVFPQIWVYGSQSSGKTRLLELLSEISYRGIMASHITSAALATLTEQAKATIFMDETENLNQKENPDLWNFILTRYRKGQYYICKNKDTGNVDMQACWGLSAFAGRDRPNEPLGSRCILIIAKKQIGVPKNADPLFAESLGHSLFFLRISFMSHMSQICEEIGHWDDRDMYMIHRNLLINNNKTHNSNSAKYDRTDEIVQPLLLLTKVMSHLSHMSRNIVKYIEKRRQEQYGEELESLDVEVLGAIDFYIMDKKDNPSASEITDLVNTPRNEKEKISARYVGKVMKRLGYKQSTSHSIKRFYIIDEKRHKYNKQRFGLDDEEDEAPKESKGPESSLSEPQQKLEGNA